MLFRRRRRGIGFTGILIIVALLYFTGAGKWLWNGVLEVPGQCYNLMAQAGISMGASACGAIGTGIAAIDSAFSDMGGTLHTAVDSLKNIFAGSRMNSVVGTLHIPDSLQNFGSSNADLHRLLGFGPSNLPNGPTAADKLRNAVDSFHIGRDLMTGTGNSVQNGVAWFKQGASINGYGMLSQLSLGDIYREGRGDVAADPRQSASYYAQAYHSIESLQANPSPEAHKLLDTLPGSPETVKQQLVQTIRSMNLQIK